MPISDGEYIEGNGFIAEIIRSHRRKTASIRVDDRMVSVVVPTELSEQRISQLLKDKHRWIKTKIRDQKQVQPVSQKLFVSGEAFSYLGRNYRLKVIRGAYKPVKLIQGRLVATFPHGADEPAMVRNALVRWYRAQAEPKLIEKTLRYAETIGVTPTSIGIKHYKARWGSCNAKGRIDFNWQLVMAPHAAVDYVVVHELCHLKHFNHGKDYWKQVERVMPDFKTQQGWLKVHAKELMF